MKTISDVEQFVRTSALMAFDQAADYDNIHASIAAHAINVEDTLKEHNLKHFTLSAMTAYYSFVSQFSTIKWS